MANESPVTLNTVPGSVPDIGKARVIQIKAQRLVNMMRDLRQPKGIREAAKLAFDTLQREALLQGLEVSYAPPPPTGPAVVSGEMRSEIAAAERFGRQMGTAPAAPAQAPLEVTVPPGPPTVVPQLGANVPKPVFPEQMQLPPQAGPAPTQVSTEAPTGFIGPPEQAQRLPDSGVPTVTPDAILPPEGESADVAALRAFTQTPFPTLEKAQYTRAEGIALAFLAGLKGIESALPFINMKESRVQREFEAKAQGYQTQQRGLMGLAELSQREGDRREMARLRAAQLEFNSQLRLAADERARQSLLLRADAAERADRMLQISEARFKRPLPTVMGGIQDMGQIIRDLDELIPLVESGAGGPIASGVFQSQKWSPDTIRAATLWGDARTLLAPDRIGRAQTQLELTGTAADFFNIGISNSRGRQLSVLRTFRDMAQARLDGLATVYDPETIYRLAGVAARTGAGYPSAPLPAIPPGAIEVPEGELVLYDSVEAQ